LGNEFPKGISNLDIQPASMNIHQLEERIAEADSVQEKIDATNQLAWRLRICQPERARSLSQDTASLAKPDEYTVYNQGLAASLITLAFLDSEEGNLEAAVSRCLEALSFLKGGFEDNRFSESLIAAWYTLGWIYFYSGDYPAALGFGLKALNKAEEVGIKEIEAWALDLAASTYKDPTQAIPMYQKALRIFEETKDIEGQVRTLNNWACTLLEIRDYSTALEYSQKGMQLAQAGMLKRDEININSTLGEIFIAMGEYAQAQSYFEKAKHLIENYGRDISYLYILIGLGEVFLAQKELDNAERELLGALNIATQADMRSEQARCHRLLSSTYEQRGQFDKALEYYKFFHSLKEGIAGASVAKQVTALKLSYQIETAQRDAEIQRLQNEKLQLELDEHKRMHVILENLATRDPLTNLYNRRHFLALAEQEWKRALRYKHPICVLMLDLDHFKNINDTYGHATGDQTLITVAGIIQAALRATEIAGRYGGDEFAIVLPETIGKNGLIVSKRIHDGIVNQIMQTKTESFNLSVSIGVAELSDTNREQIKTLYELLNQADQALYISKKSANNSISLYSET
jgi:diguanylate cyclase (GGDEF)-like protein